MFVLCVSTLCLVICDLKMLHQTASTEVELHEIARD